MRYKFQHFVDIATSASSMQIINFNVGGRDVINRCAHLFNAYRYFKLGKISVKFVPASTLPVDPLGLSYSDSDPLTVDPRDQLNCGLVRITNGEDLMTDLTGVSATDQEQMYNAMLLDPHWYKFSLQAGFKRTARPLYWQVGQVHSDIFPGAVTNVPAPRTDNTPGVRTEALAPNQPDVSTSAGYTSVEFYRKAGESSNLGLFQTGHRGRLGYLPTDAYQYIYAYDKVNSTDISGQYPFVHPVPQIRTITCVLPKMHKTIYYYRVYITEEVFFSGLRSIAPMTSVSQMDAYVNRGIDTFIEPPDIHVSKPSNTATITTTPYQFPMNDGGNNDGSY